MNEKMMDQIAEIVAWTVAIVIVIAVCMPLLGASVWLTLKIMGF